MCDQRRSVVSRESHNIFLDPAVRIFNRALTGCWNQTSKITSMHPENGFKHDCSQQKSTGLDAVSLLCEAKKLSEVSENKIAKVRNCKISLNSNSGDIPEQDSHWTPIQKTEVCHPPENVMELPVTTDCSPKQPKKQMKSVVSVVRNFLPSDSDFGSGRPSLKRSSSVLDNSHESPQINSHRLSDAFMSERGSDSALLRLQPRPKEVLKHHSSTPSSISGNSGRNVTVLLNTPECFTPNTKCSERRVISGHRRSLTFPSGTNKRSAADVSPFSPQSRSSESSPVRRFKRMRTDTCIPSYDLRSISSKFPVGIIDSHCHLDFLFTREDHHGSYSKYRRMHSETFSPCLEGCITIFCEPQNFLRKAAWNSLLQESGVWAAFGCHPHMASSYSDEAEEALIEALKDPKVVAIGEIGLDYSKRNSCDKQRQKTIFRRQLTLAVRYQRTLVLHCRDAHDDCIEIMKEEIPRKHTIHLHCFTDTWERLSEWLSEFPNLYVGVTNLVTYPTAENVHNIARRIPLQRLLLETDTPYFVPKNMTSRWSHPGMVMHAAAQVAAFRSEISLQDLLKIVRENTHRVYGI